VWVVTEPTISNPSFEEDIRDDLPLASLFFRFFLIGASTSYSTIEPGIQKTITEAPSNIRIQEAPDFQSAWVVSSLLAKSTVSKSKKAVESALENHGSPLSQAVFTCISLGYTFGQQIQGNAQAGQLSPQEIQSQLSSYVGISDSLSACGKKIEAADAASVSKAEAPDLSPRKVQVETIEDPEWRDAGESIDNAARDLERLIGRAHE
jgi:hypothetical protein